MKIILDLCSWLILSTTHCLHKKKDDISNARVGPKYYSYYRGFILSLLASKQVFGWLPKWWNHYKMLGSSKSASHCGNWAHPSARHPIKGQEDQMMEPTRATGQFELLLVIDDMGMVP